MSALLPLLIPGVGMGAGPVTVVVPPIRLLFLAWSVDTPVLLNWRGDTLLRMNWSPTPSADPK